ncbi:MAG TPA: DUF2090 domain-containing protein [Actinomycetota bacterium]|jgi:myo-inositol catabolism protein IolC|nr:DUF2090 domain-containing protein [Actinomycetota bacterium]
MPRGYTGQLYILAFDHRGSFRKKLGVGSDPSPEELDRIIDAKRLIFEGFQQAIQDGVPKESAGLLVDEEYGADVARKARAEGFNLAMPVEKSGQDEFDFEYGRDYGGHIEDFDPTFSKVLVRYNPQSDREMNANQGNRLRELGDWLHERNRLFLFELLVPALPEQLEEVGGDENRYDKEVRPQLMLQTIQDLHGFGVEPDIWKIEGLDTRDDCELIAAATRSDGRDDVACVVLGRGADDQAVEHWLRQGAGVSGYVGFAIGRTIWGGPLSDFAGGSVERGEAARRIAANYRRFVDIYAGA